MWQDHSAFTVNFRGWMLVLQVETPPLHSLQKLKSSCIHIVQWILADQEVEVPCAFTQCVCQTDL